MKVKITSWDKYNPKRAQQTYTWLRLNNDVFMSRELFGLDAEQKAIWIFILCIASKHNTGELDLDSDYIAHHLPTKAKKVMEAVKMFMDSGLLQITTPDYTQQLQHTTPTNERTNERDERTNEPCKPPPSAADIEKLYELYPLKKGKHGLKKAKTICRTWERYNQVKNAIENYTEKCVAAKTEARYILHFSTFMGRWEEYLDENWGDASHLEAKQTENDWDFLQQCEVG